MNLGLVLVSVLLMVAGFVATAEDAALTPPASPATSEAPPPDPVLQDPAPEGPVPSPEQNLPAPKQPEGMIVKEFEVGTPNEGIENPTIDSVQLSGSYKGVIYLNEYIHEGQPFSAKVLRYTKKFDKKFGKRVEIRIQDGEESLEPIMFNCRVCDVPKVYIGKGKFAVYHDKDIYGVLINKPKKIFVTMRNHLCIDKRPSTSIVKKPETIDERCKEYMAEMKNPQRSGFLHSFILFFTATIPKLLAELHLFLAKPPPAPPAPAAPKPKPSIFKKKP